MAETTINERAPTAAVPDEAQWIERLLTAESAATGGTLATLAWEAPQPWLGGVQERRVGRASGVEVVSVRAADGLVAVRVRRSAPPAFELTWKRGAEIAVSATVPDERVAPLREALRALLTPSAAPAPERAKTRAELLEAIAAWSTAVGDELSALDHGVGSWERIATCDREVRRAIDELSDDDAAPLRAVVNAGLTSAWSDLARVARERVGARPDAARLRERAMALRAAAIGGGAGAARAWAAAAARTRDALEVDPPRRPAAHAAELLRLAHFEAASGNVAEARAAFELAMNASATVARRSLFGAPLEAWRAELAPIAYRGRLPKAVAPYEDALADTWVPLAKLIAVGSNSEAMPASRMGGDPSLPTSVAWPNGPDGAAMSFLLQVDLATVSLPRALPRGGLLLFFITDDARRGRRVMEAGVRVLYVSDPPSASTSAPATAKPLVPRRCALSSTSEVEPASTTDVALARRCPALAADPKAKRALAKAFSSAHTKLGGYAYFNQQDPRQTDSERADHLQLLQVCEEPAAGLAWGDAGVGHVFVPPNDLARLDFTRAWWWFDCL